MKTLPGSLLLLFLTGSAFAGELAPVRFTVHEAAALEADLRRAGIKPYAWVVNQSLTPLTLSDPLLRARRRAEDR